MVFQSVNLTKYYFSSNIISGLYRAINPGLKETRPMKKLIWAALTALVLTATPTLSLAQQNKERVVPIGDVVVDPTRVGMVYFYEDHAKTSVEELSASLAKRDKGFEELAVRVKGGDPNKVRLWQRNISEANTDVSISFARAKDDAVNLQREAGLALNNRSSSSVFPKITEKEYDEMIEVIAGLPTSTPEPTKDQMLVWSAAVKITGVDYLRKD
jgi:hypothetical protein